MFGDPGGYWPIRGVVGILPISGDYLTPVCIDGKPAKLSLIPVMLEKSPAPPIFGV